MNPTLATRPLAGPLRARINRLAHSHALQHETRLKASLLKQIQTARDGGASFAELAVLVVKLEAALLEDVHELHSSALRIPTPRRMPRAENVPLQEIEIMTNTPKV